MSDPKWFDPPVPAKTQDIGRIYEVTSVRTASQQMLEWTKRGPKVPADGFYEWTKSPADGGKDPRHVSLPGHRAFSFAGLWVHKKKLNITSCTIITASAGDPCGNPLLRFPSVARAGLDH